MALGIPAVASNVGVNSEIITNGENGFLCSTEEQWLDAIKKLINQKELRSQVGRRGRISVEAHYSVAANTSNFLSLFERE
jgi:glycosyltransferase involved in cell wall biosynthesis